MVTVKGRPRKWPLPKKTNAGCSKVTIWPSVMSMAMPRPTTMRMSVAMIGWMRSRVTSRPFHAPSAAPASTHSTSTAAKGRAVVVTSSAASAPVIAMTEPTDKSTPPVPMTSVMPSASSMTFAPWLSTSTSVP